MNRAERDELAAILVKYEVLSSEQLHSVASGAASSGASLEEALLEAKLVTRATLLSVLMEHHRVPYVAMPEKVDVQVLKLVPAHLIEAYQAAPLSVEAGELTLAMTEPGNAEAADRIAASTGFSVKRVGVLRSDFKRFYSKYFEDSTMSQILKEIEIHRKEAVLSGEEPVASALAPEAAERPVVRLVDALLNAAVRKRASDVHIEPQKEFALVRFRIDGLLQTQQLLPAALMPNLAARIKVLAELNITERRAPQDGKFLYRLPDREIDVRVAVMPSRYGEKVALRVLDRHGFLIGIDLLGLEPELQTQIEGMITRPNGLFLVTGPTGSGKTTTLYALLQRLRSPHLNIMTLEDPIEYELLAESRREGGITQIQLNRACGLDFASGLRACLRQDPDVLFLGEIRDRETAETAISAALTGHMVLSSLHTNGAIQTVARLLDMGVEPFLVVSALRGVLSQRLLRMLCHHCKQAFRPPADALARLGLPAEGEGTFFRPVGCASCQQQGYWGRTGVFEFLPLRNSLNRLILERRPPGELFEAARKDFGFRTLKEHGMALAAQGVTSVEDVLRVLPSL